MKQRTRKKSIWIALAVILVIVVLLLCLGIRKASKDELAEREKAVKDAVQTRALQCYVIEGAYPESLSYLVENYGLAVNQKEYKIIYHSYAENMPPEIQVIYRGKQQ